MSRAVVLSGGGPVGAAWESGLLAGLAHAGVDLGLADLILGTSAGALVGARLAAGKPAGELAEALLARGAEAPRGSAADGLDAETFGRFMALLREGQPAAEPSLETRKKIGALSLAGKVVSEDAFVSRIGLGLYEARDAPWPERFACTAVDVADGRLKLWNADAKAPLLKAVASSCSVPGISPPVTIDGRRYMDGGMRSASNADLAGGFDLVVVVSVQPPGARTWMAERLDKEVERLAAQGSRVVTFVPDQGSGAAFGDDFMNLARNAEIAQAGVAQGRNEAGALREIWT